MYTSYSTLQRKQLSKQVYTDTQSTYLLVYAPGRHKALETALQNQLHRKFRLVTRLEGELTPDEISIQNKLSLLHKCRYSTIIRE